MGISKSYELPDDESTVGFSFELLPLPEPELELPDDPELLPLPELPEEDPLPLSDELPFPLSEPELSPPEEELSPLL